MRGASAPFVMAALAGLCAQSRVSIDEGAHGHQTADDIAARALSIGKATAAALEAELDEYDRAPDSEAPPPGITEERAREIFGDLLQASLASLAAPPPPAVDVPVEADAKKKKG